MAIANQVMKKEGIVHLRLSGLVSGEDIISTLDTIWRDPHCLTSYHQFWDGRDISELVVDWPDMMNLVKLARRRPPTTGLVGRVAVVAPRFIDYTFARAILAQTKRCHGEKEVFREMGEAVRWLEIASTLSLRDAFADT
ncbi:MAG: hypothetical protein SH809_00530 [Rhodothermales bacterium]|nr:hypothetical protein [Rhodothermales bacterium]